MYFHPKIPRLNLLYFLVLEEKFDRFHFKFEGGRFFTRGPYGERGRNRALFIIDPDGNETEINTRYLYGVPQRA